MRPSLCWVAVLAMAACAQAQQAPATGSAGAGTAGQAAEPKAVTGDATPAGHGATAASDAKTVPHHPSKKDRVQAQKLFVAGAKDIANDRIRAAIDEFTRASELDPEEKKYELADQVAREHLVTKLIQQSDKDKILGRDAAAREAIDEAYRIDPASPEVAQHVDELASTEATGEPAAQPDGVEAAPPIELKPKPGLQSFHVRGNERTVVAEVLPAFGIVPTLDDSVGAQPVRFDADNVDFATTERLLELATNTFIVPLDPARALVARNTTLNREKYERMTVETVYLPGMASSEVTELANTIRSVFALRTVAPAQGRLTVRGPTAVLSALNATLKGLLEGRSELLLDVEMYEVDRTKAVNLGAILPNQTTLFNVYSEARNVLNSNASLVQEIVSSGLAAPGDWEAILAILIASGQLSNSILTQPFGVFGGGLTLTGVEYQGGATNMQLNSSDVRTIDQLQLRVLDGAESTIKAGERYPIETSSYSSLGASSNLNIPGLSNAGLSSTLQNLGVNLSQLQASESLTIPQVQYQDIGLTLNVTPSIENSKRVSLKFELTLTSLAGSSINGLPVMTNRNYTAITSMATGESAILVSSLSRQESDAITGIPGLSEIPGFQSLTNKSTNLDVGELAIVITPHIVRAVHRDATEKMVMLPVGQPGP
ncbi:MAG TPA: hypothetical protein VL990_18735 [Acidobacteriaceae bacterium]|nr:hypothetical protein [Acidobacteriaceae bacterium]